MTPSTSIEKVILDEFTAYYLIDELPNLGDPNFLENDLPAMALMSAERLIIMSEDKEREQLINILQNIRDNKSHRLIQEIAERSLMNWADSPQTWLAFQRLLDLVIINLK